MIALLVATVLWAVAFAAAATLTSPYNSGRHRKPTYRPRHAVALNAGGTA
ncbi:MAG TPA: hypothetical protein VF062_15425 [Candidatus Limnocylindrales bacterium]